MEVNEHNLECIRQGHNKFAANLYRLIENKQKNTLLSFTSIHSVLTLISQDPWLYNKKKTFDRFLYIDTNQAGDYKHILTLLNSIGDIHLLANKAFYKNNYEVQEHFTSHLLSNFLYELNSLDFDKNDMAMKSINNWFDDKAKIKDAVDSGIVDDKTALALLNAIHFSSKWAKPFSHTIPGQFCINENNTIPVEMMRIKSEFYYKNDIVNGHKILQLPYVNDDISLLVILPNRPLDWAISIHQEIENLTSGMSLQEVIVSIPKFKIEDAIELKDYISKMGLECAFTTDLTGIINGEEINLTRLAQKTFIDVNQDGSETGGGMECILNKAEEKKVTPKNGLVIYEMDIKTEISNRFAKTKVICKTKNVEKIAKEASFKVILTKTAFITGFVMEIEGKSYKSYIKEKEEAKIIYNAAVARGQSAGLVAAETRDSKEFSVCVNLEPESVAVFNLTYEEMLQRVHDQYELVLNICPGQIVDNLNIQVDIMEIRPLKFVKTPPIRSGKDISRTDYEKYLDPLSNIQLINAKTASIKFSPDTKRQRTIAHYLDCKESGGLFGQFVVQYDVERDPQDGQILLQDGYFVHFFAPNDLDPLPKHVLFVLDTSGSMGGRKLIQLKDAMKSILNEIRKNDIISIIEFSSNVMVWDINLGTSVTVPVFYDPEHFEDPFNILSQLNLPNPIVATGEAINKAKDVVEKIRAFGSTYIIGGLETALYLVKNSQDKMTSENEKYQPIIVFLTDGQPNVGISSTEKIVEVVTLLNSQYNKIPIFSLSFGTGADKKFLRKLSLKNQGFSRHIYEAADASLQLQEFYKQISSPLLRDVQFKYDSDVEEVTRTYFPIYFRGSEIVVSGRYKDSSFPAIVNCWGPSGIINITSIIDRPITSLERLWAYLTVKQLLDERDIVDDKTELTKKATALALKYSFVTDVTSLVVVKPNDTSTLDNSTPGDDILLESAMSAPMMSHAFGSTFGSVQRRMMSLRARSIGFAAAGTAQGNMQGSTGFGAGVIAQGQGSIQGQNSSLFGSSATPLFQNMAGSTGFGAGVTAQGNTQAQSSSVFGSSAMTRSKKMAGHSSMLHAKLLIPNTGDSYSDSFNFPSTEVATDFNSGAFSFGMPLNLSTRDSSNESFQFGVPSNQNTTEGPDAEKKKGLKEFVADHPFYVILQFKKENKTIILFEGFVCKPN